MRLCSKVVSQTNRCSPLFRNKTRQIISWGKYRSWLQWHHCRLTPLDSQHAKVKRLKSVCWQVSFQKLLTDGGNDLFVCGETAQKKEHLKLIDSVGRLKPISLFYASTAVLTAKPGRELLAPLAGTGGSEGKQVLMAKNNVGNNNKCARVCVCVSPDNCRQCCFICCQLGLAIESITTEPASTTRLSISPAQQSRIDDSQAGKGSAE